MQLFDFIDIHFQNKSYENQIKYSIKTDGELKALHWLVNFELKFFRFIAIFKFIFMFLGVRFFFQEKPVNKVPKPVKPEIIKTEAPVIPIK
jgi:hypothetical protein